ncbi:MAG: 2-dehydropantoate 2-reductase [Anaerolineales bacterium]
MRFLIIGAGAIGGYVGGSLALGGHAVTFLARAAIAASLRTVGLRLEDALSNQSRAINPVVAETPAEVQASGPFDCAVLATKAYDTAAAARTLKLALPAPPPILCLQNGVDGETELATLFSAESLIAGTVTSAISKAGPGSLIIEKARGMGVALGHPLSQPLVAALNGAGLRARAYPASGPMKWSKLLTNLTGNATSAILDLTVAQVFADPNLFAVEMASLRETLAVMAALSYPVVDLPGVPVRALAFASRLPAWLARPLLLRGVAGGRGGKMPSLHIDLHAGRPQTEVRWLHGAVAHHGAIAGVPAPVNQMLYDTLEALSAGQLDKETFRSRPQALLARLPNTKPRP